MSPRCRALVWMCQFQRSLSILFLPSPFYGGVLSFNTTTPYSSACLLLINFQFRFCAYQEAPCHLRPLLSPLGKADLPPLSAAPVLPPCREEPPVGTLPATLSCSWTSSLFLTYPHQHLHTALHAC